MNKPKIIFVTGLGGTGKSTLVDYFSKNPITGWEFFDFDEGKYKIPKNKQKRKEWRKIQHECWMEFAKSQYLEKGLNSVIMGVCLFPWEVKSFPKPLKRSNFYYGYLYCEPEERKARLIKRGTPHLWEGDLEKYVKIAQRLDKLGAKKFNTTLQSIKEIAEKINRWLRNIN